MNGLRWICGVLCCVGLLFGGGQVFATTINIDIDSRDDGAHVGDNGVFSSGGGTTWNRIGLSFLSNRDLFNVLDEFGVATDVDVTFDANGSFDANGRALELYAGGGTGVMDIKNLVSSNTYDLAIYTTNPNLNVSVTDQTGSSAKSTGATFDLELPGDGGEEYLIFTDLSPFDLGGGMMGLTIATLGSPASATRMAGFQLRDSAAVPEPSTVAVFALGSLVFLASTCRKRFFQRSRVIVRPSVKGNH